MPLNWRYRPRGSAPIAWKSDRPRVILGSTHRRAPVGFAGIAIGLALTLSHLISIPVTNTSVNPARSTGPASFAGGWALAQLWFFWVFPLIGAAVAGFVYGPSSRLRFSSPPISGRPAENALG